jgi:hypothetical protein
MNDVVEKHKQEKAAIESAQRMFAGDEPMEAEPGIEAEPEVEVEADDED